MTWIELEGAVNVRDLGGLPTTDGGTTVPGRLLRSENLQELTPGDVARLVDEIGVTTVVDLRSTNEVMIEGPAPLDALAGVRHAHHPVLKEFLDVSDTVKAALVTEAAQADRERYPADPMCGHYLGYLENRPEEVVGALRSIATAPGAAIVHCAAGKDRTGVSSPSPSPWPGWSRRPSWPTTSPATSGSRRSSSGWPAPRCTRAA